MYMLTWLFPMPWHMYMPGSPPGSFFANVSKHWSVPRLRTYKSIQVRVKKRVKKTWWLKKKCQAKAKEAKASLANYKIKKKSFSAIMETKYRQANEYPNKEMFSR